MWSFSVSFLRKASYTLLFAISLRRMITLDSTEEKSAFTPGLGSPWPARCFLIDLVMSSSWKIWAKSPSLNISATNCDWVEQQVIKRSRKLTNQSKRSACCPRDLQQLLKLFTNFILISWDWTFVVLKVDSRDTRSPIGCTSQMRQHNVKKTTASIYTWVMKGHRWRWGLI